MLNHFVVFGESHLRSILSCWLTHCHFQRPHQGLGNVTVDAGIPPPDPVEGIRPDNIVCYESLGGLLKHYTRVAA